MVHGWLFKLARHSRSCMTLHRPGQPKNLQNLLGSSPGMGACDLGRLWFPIGDLFLLRTLGSSSSSSVFFGLFLKSILDGLVVVGVIGHPSKQEASTHFPYSKISHSKKLWVASSSSIPPSMTPLGVGSRGLVAVYSHNDGIPVIFWLFHESGNTLHLNWRAFVL